MIPFSKRDFYDSKTFKGQHILYIFYTVEFVFYKLHHYVNENMPFKKMSMISSFESIFVF